MILKDPGLWTTIEATVKIRRGDGWDVSPRGEAADGIRHLFKFAWHIEAEDSSIYVGETAWTPHPFMSDDWPNEDGPTWIASGDLSDVKLIVAEENSSDT